MPYSWLARHTRSTEPEHCRRRRRMLASWRICAYIGSVCLFVCGRLRTSLRFGAVIHEGQPATMTSFLDSLQFIFTIIYTLEAVIKISGLRLKGCAHWQPGAVPHRQRCRAGLRRVCVPHAF